ncbi:MAG: hypothetical protein Q8J74_09300 [Candidatus Didemnitutus sp.]|nr:hypothetical protein [Candidatus Didemnitutus sp.]
MRLPSFFPVIAVLALLAVPLRAADGGFTTTLSVAQQTGAGLGQLSAGEQTVLNTLVAREVSLARQGNVRAFAGTFSSRRPPEERTAAGLERLTADELAQLDSLVAAALAASPILPTAPGWLREKDLTAPDRLEIHGEVSASYGVGTGGRSLRGGSFSTNIRDRETGVTIGIGISHYEGDGYWLYDGRYGDNAFGTSFRSVRPWSRPVIFRER